MLWGLGLAGAPSIAATATLAVRALRGRARPGLRSIAALAAGGIAWIIGDVVRGDLVDLAAGLWDAFPIALAVVVATTPSARTSARTAGRIGIVTGLAALAALAWWQALGAPWVSESFVGRGYGFARHPNVFAGTVVALAAALAASPGPGTRRGLALAALAVVASGSRTGLLGWTVVAAFVFAEGTAGDPRRRHRLLAATAGGLLALFAILFGLTGWGARFLPFAAPSSTEANALAASEDLGQGPWTALGVSVRETVRSRVLARVPAEFVVTKVDPAWWSRSQQLAPLPASGQVELAFDVRADPEVEPGVHGVVRGGGDLTVRRGPDGWRVSVSGALAVVEWTVRGEPGDWERVRVRLAHETDAAATIAYGPTPDQRSGVVGGEATFRRLLWVVDGDAEAYAPTFFRAVDGRTSFGTFEGRLAYLRVAWAGLRDRPITGHGSEAFATASAAELGRAVGHPHQALAAIAYERGVPGLLALGLALMALVRSPAPRRTRWLWAATLVALGSFDATWFASGAVALACWSLAGDATRRTEGTPPTVRCGG